MPEQEIIEPTEEMIDQWKQTHHSVYVVTLAGSEYYYRPLLRAEWRNINQTAGNQGGFMGMPTPDVAFKIEEQTTQMTLLWPKLSLEGLQAVPAGVITRLNDLIMESSGFDTEAVATKL